MNELLLRLYPNARNPPIPSLRAEPPRCMFVSCRDYTYKAEPSYPIGGMAWPSCKRHPGLHILLGFLSTGAPKRFCPSTLNLLVNPGSRSWPENSVPEAPRCHDPELD
ncbi:hypothetical protein LIA77_11064 [Sarocladium implicatum]|nr:hypothetical protein LIA77_11064 [Sarocladium implicatum]